MQSTIIYLHICIIINLFADVINVNAATYLSLRYKCMDRALTTIIANIGPIKAKIVPCLVGNQHLRDGHIYRVCKGFRIRNMHH